MSDARKFPNFVVGAAGTQRAVWSCMSPAVHLTLIDTRACDRHEEVFHRLPVRIGRHNLNDCLVDTSEASRFHAQLRLAPDGAGLELIDLGSRNGTIVDGRRLRVDEPTPLRLGPEAFRIGPIRFDVRTAPSIEFVRPSIAPPRADLDAPRAALLVLRRLAELYVPNTPRLKTADDVLAFGTRLRDALDALATHYALLPRPKQAVAPLKVVQAILDAKLAGHALYEIDADLADAHLREQRLLQGFEQGLRFFLAQAGVGVEEFLGSHGELFGALSEMRERLAEDPTPAEQVA